MALFDILTRPELNLTKKEEKEVKGIARQLLKTLTEEKLVLDWRKKQQTRAAVKLAIEEILDKLLTLFDKVLYNQKCQLVYNYGYEMF